jgi:quercetin dioxygenase-like cupin family protein
MKIFINIFFTIVKKIKPIYMVGIASENGYTEILPGIRIKTLCYGKAMLMSEFLLQKSALLPLHEHPYEQTGYLVKGNMKLTIGEVSQNILPGYSWSIPAGVSHFAEIIEDSVAVEVFSPVREDYLKFVNQEDIR